MCLCVCEWEMKTVRVLQSGFYLGPVYFGRGQPRLILFLSVCVCMCVCVSVCLKVRIVVMAKKFQQVNSELNIDYLEEAHFCPVPSKSGTIYPVEL